MNGDIRGLVKPIRAHFLVRDLPRVPALSHLQSPLRSVIQMLPSLQAKRYNVQQREQVLTSDKSSRPEHISNYLETC